MKKIILKLILITFTLPAFGILENLETTVTLIEGTYTYGDKQACSATFDKPNGHLQINFFKDGYGFLVTEEEFVKLDNLNDNKEDKTDLTVSDGSAKVTLIVGTDSLGRLIISEFKFTLQEKLIVCTNNQL